VASGVSYSFGDTATAEERLVRLATVFDLPSRTFVRDVVTGPPALACDLGCGPGYTTRMLRDVTGARRTVGLDSSAAFISSARDQAGVQSARDQAGVQSARDQAGVQQPEFLVGDVTDTLPVSGPDLIYARMLLAHLPAPARQAAAWAGQLAPGGLLLLDEVERIDTSSELFTDYLTVVVARIHAAGTDMYAGSLLGEIPLGADCTVIADQVVTHPVPAQQAARLFRLNLSVWGGDPWVAARFGEDTTARLDRELAQVQHGEITWHLRQVAIQRSAGS
jgi:trans-aconitate 2-methyltransferase